MAHDVFISHSSKDKTIADAVCGTFEANGIAVGSRRAMFRQVQTEAP